MLFAYLFKMRKTENGRRKTEDLRRKPVGKAGLKTYFDNYRTIGILLRIQKIAKLCDQLISLDGVETFEKVIHDRYFLKAKFSKLMQRKKLVVLTL